jgi:hypothetical protein
MTLVEVVAGLALLGAVLVTLLQTKAALHRQRAEADRRIRAVDAADALLAGWHADGANVPHHGGGTAGADGAFHWTTRVVRRQRVEELTMDVVRLEVSGGDREVGVEPDRGAHLLASVELLVPTEENRR